jgi:hypothetical protein
MRIVTVIRPLAAAVLTTSALGLAACGGDDAAGESPSASREKQAREAGLQYARCMREHGIDMPDPTPGQPGIRLSLPKGASPAKAKAADQACSKYLAKIKSQPMSEEQQKKFRDAALANARCMREHGIDMPDPTFGPNGEATIKMRAQKGSGGIDPKDPRFEEAQKACEKLLPRPGGDPDGGPSTQESSP